MEWFQWQTGGCAKLNILAVCDVNNTDIVLIVALFSGLRVSRTVEYSAQLLVTCAQTWEAKSLQFCYLLLEHSFVIIRRSVAVHCHVTVWSVVQLANARCCHLSRCPLSMLFCHMPEIWIFLNSDYNLSPRKKFLLTFPTCMLIMWWGGKMLTSASKWCHFCHLRWAIGTGAKGYKLTALIKVLSLLTSGSI